MCGIHPFPPLVGAHTHHHRQCCRRSCKIVLAFCGCLRMVGRNLSSAAIVESAKFQGQSKQFALQYDDHLSNGERPLLLVSRMHSCTQFGFAVRSLLFPCLFGEREREGENRRMRELKGCAGGMFCIKINESAKTGPHSHHHHHSKLLSSWVMPAPS